MPEKKYIVGEFSSHWFNGEQPTDTHRIEGTDKLVEFIRNHDLIHNLTEEMYGGVELRIVRTSNGDASE